MKRKRHAPEQIITELREADAMLAAWAIWCFAIRSVDNLGPAASTCCFKIPKPTAVSRLNFSSAQQTSHTSSARLSTGTSRRRCPQYDHCAEIVAEEITARFLNVISLFNGFIPLIAIQMTALRINSQVALIFTKVLDEMTLGLVEEDEEIQEVTDRAYWENVGTPRTVAIADELLKMIHTFDQSLELKYNKFYIGLSQDGQPNNFVILRAKKDHPKLEPRLDRSAELDEKLDSSGLDVMDYDTRWRRYRIRLRREDFEKHQEFILNLMKQAYDARA